MTFFSIEYRNDYHYMWCNMFKTCFVYNFHLKQKLNITPKIAEYEKILRMDSILGG